MLIDDDRPRPPPTVTVGSDLSALSESELTERITALEAEIARVTAALTAKRASRSAAERAFKRS